MKKYCSQRLKKNNNKFEKMTAIVPSRNDYFTPTANRFVFENKEIGNNLYYGIPEIKTNVNEQMCFTQVFYKANKKCECFNCFVYHISVKQSNKKISSGFVFIPKSECLSRDRIYNFITKIRQI